MNAARGMTMNDCIFCDIAAQRATASVVLRDDRATAFLDINPVTPGHLVVIPNDHFALLGEIPEDVAAHVFTVATRLASALRASGLPCEGINLFLADGEAAFQDVFHTHLHVIPRSQVMVSRSTPPPGQGLNPVEMSLTPTPKRSAARSVRAPDEQSSNESV